MSRRPAARSAATGPGPAVRTPVSRRPAAPAACARRLVLRPPVRRRLVLRPPVRRRPALRPPASRRLAARSAASAFGPAVRTTCCAGVLRAGVLRADVLQGALPQGALPQELAALPQGPALAARATAAARPPLAAARPLALQVAPAPPPLRPSPAPAPRDDLRCTPSLTEVCPVVSVTPEANERSSRTCLVQVRLFFCAISSCPFSTRSRVILCPISEIMRIRETFRPNTTVVALLSDRSLFVVAIRGRGLPMFRMALGLGFCRDPRWLPPAARCAAIRTTIPGPSSLEDGCQSSAHARAGSILGGAPQPSLSPAKSHGPQIESGAHRPLRPAPDRRAPKQANVPEPIGLLRHRSAAECKGRVQGQRPARRRAGLGTDRFGDRSGGQALADSSAESCQVRVESWPESSKALPSAGWTARRPTTEVLR